MQCVIIILIAGDTCLLGENRAMPGDYGGIMVTVQLQCTVNREVPQPIPTPSLTWFRNGLKVAHAVLGEHFTINDNLPIQFSILNPGVFSMTPFLLLTSGELIFTTEINNITMPMLGNLAPDTTLRQARAMLFEILLANWTCVAYSSLGTAAVEHLIGVCGKLEELLQFDIMTIQRLHATFTLSFVLYNKHINTGELYFSNSFIPNVHDCIYTGYYI